MFRLHKRETTMKNANSAEFCIELFCPAEETIKTEHDEQADDKLMQTTKRDL